MIKNLRSIIAVAFMTVCASVSAQSTFDFKALYESKVNEKLVNTIWVTQKS